MNFQLLESAFDLPLARINEGARQQAHALRLRYAAERGIPFEHTVADLAPSEDGMRISIIIREFQEGAGAVLVPPPWRQER